MEWKQLTKLARGGKPTLRADFSPPTGGVDAIENPKSDRLWKY